MTSSLKTKVLAKCAELAPQIYGNYIFEGKTIERTATQVRIYADWGAVRFNDSISETDEIWPLAANILGIEYDQAAKDRELVKELFEDGWKPNGYLTIHVDAPSGKAIKRLAGMGVQNGL